MSDLISRSKLLKEIETWGGCVEALHEYIANMPTAYDIDNVVDDLEYYRKDVPEDKDYYSWISAIDNAIEIVKQGGVSDDVCEWESDYGFISDKYKRETQCGYTFYDLHHAVAFKYCPYCGKKIKVVE